MWNFILGMIFMALAFCVGIAAANAQESVQTTVTVVITEEVSSANVTASVPCNDVNCAATTTAQQSENWFGRIISWFKNLL